MLNGVSFNDTVNLRNETPSTMHLDRVISVLEAVAVAGRAISAVEIHRVTNLPKPTCYRLLQSLNQHGLLDQAEQDGRYVVGKRFMRIALMGQSDADIRLATVPILKDAAIEMGEAFFLSRFRNDGVEIIHVETPEDPKVSFIHPGFGFRPMNACSCSKVIAAFSESAFQEKVFQMPMKAYTDSTKTKEPALREEFERIRQQGFAECVEEVELGISSVAAPVLLDGVSASFSIGATGSIHNFTPTRRQEVGEALQHYASKIGTMLSATYLHGKQIDKQANR